MIAIHHERLNDNIDSFKDEIDLHIEQVRSSLYKQIKSGKLCIKNVQKPLTETQKFYLRYLRSKLEKIVFADPEQLDGYLKIFDKIIPLNIRRNKSVFTPFKNELIKMMGYETLRSDDKKALYPKFFNKLGINTCVYCNSQLTIAVEYADNSLVARFQVDHFVDKANYPCFSISFFNLYPVCASCNNKKGNKTIGFKLYSDNTLKIKKSDYQFVLDQESLVKFRLSKEEQLLEIQFDDNGHGLNEHLAVNGIYQTQKDLAAEIIVKSEIYNDSYKRSLKSSFKKLYGKNGIANIDFSRFIVGNYCDPIEIHKRPMAKFTHDIARQLGLIP